MKRLRLIALMMGLGFCFVAAPAQAQGIWGDACEETGSSSAICADRTQAPELVKRIIDTFLFVLGVVAVIMIVHSGMKYVISRGDPEGVKSAKNTLLYAVVGLIVAILAYAIVGFVISIFEAAPSEDSGVVSPSVSTVINLVV